MPSVSPVMLVLSVNSFSTLTLLLSHALGLCYLGDCIVTQSHCLCYLHNQPDVNSVVVKRWSGAALSSLCWITQCKVIFIYIYADCPILLWLSACLCEFLSMLLFTIIICAVVCLCVICSQTVCVYYRSISSGMLSNCCMCCRVIVCM